MGEDDKLIVVSLTHIDSIEPTWLLHKAVEFSHLRKCCFRPPSFLLKDVFDFLTERNEILRLSSKVIESMSECLRWGRGVGSKVDGNFQHYERIELTEDVVCIAATLMAISLRVRWATVCSSLGASSISHCRRSFFSQNIQRLFHILKEIYLPASPANPSHAP